MYRIILNDPDGLQLFMYTHLNMNSDFIRAVPGSNHNSAGIPLGLAGYAVLETGFVLLVVAAKPCWKRAALHCGSVARRCRRKERW